MDKLGHCSTWNTLTGAIQVLYNEVYQERVMGMAQANWKLEQMIRFMTGMQRSMSERIDLDQGSVSDWTQTRLDLITELIEEAKQIRDEEY